MLPHDVVPPLPSLCRTLFTSASISLPTNSPRSSLRGVCVAGEPTDVRYYAVAYSNKLDQRRTLSQRSAVVPTPVNIMFLNIIIIHYLYHKYLYLYHIIYILYSKSRLMTIASYGQAVTSACHHHLAITVLLLPYRTLRSWTTGAWEP